MSIKANGKDLKTLRVQNSGRPHSPGVKAPPGRLCFPGEAGAPCSSKWGDLPKAPRACL